MALIRTLDEPTFRRVDRILRAVTLVLLAVGGVVLVGSWRGWFPDGAGSVAVLLALLGSLGWISLRARLDPANAGRDRSTPEDDGYRGPLEPPRSRRTS